MKKKIIPLTNGSSFTSKESRDFIHKNGKKKLQPFLTTHQKMVQSRELFKLLNQECVEL